MKRGCVFLSFFFFFKLFPSLIGCSWAQFPSSFTIRPFITFWARIQKCKLTFDWSQTVDKRRPGGYQRSGNRIRNGETNCTSLWMLYVQKICRSMGGVHWSNDEKDKDKKKKNKKPSLKEIGENRSRQSVPVGQAVEMRRRRRRVGPTTLIYSIKRIRKGRIKFGDGQRRRLRHSSLFYFILRMLLRSSKSFIQLGIINHRPSFRLVSALAADQ